MKAEEVPRGQLVPQNYFPIPASNQQFVWNGPPGSTWIPLRTQDFRADGPTVSDFALPAIYGDHLQPYDGLLNGPILEDTHEAESPLEELANVAQKVFFLLQGLIMPQPEICSSLSPFLYASFTRPHRQFPNAQSQHSWIRNRHTPR